MDAIAVAQGWVQVLVVVLLQVVNLLGVFAIGVADGPSVDGELVSDGTLKGNDDRSDVLYTLHTLLVHRYRLLTNAPYPSLYAKSSGSGPPTSYLKINARMIGLNTNRNVLRL